ncbi:MAG TPA: NAD-dependent epimerase/dehydratase family protein [Bacteroidota bacterium]|nr:NAD-dependent epimerase/dehydratase family protein [Bacteroidota bacterium]
MNILVTGGTGFIGSHLVEQLHAQGHRVRCVAKDAMFAPVLQALGCELVLADLNRPGLWESALDGVEAVYHVAGVTRSRTPSEFYEGNFHATKTVVERCLAAGSKIRHFIYVSSLSATGPSAIGSPVCEDAPYHPVSDYGKSKMLAESVVLKAQDRLPVTIIRPSAVYGPRERDMYDYIKAIRRGCALMIGLHDKLMSLIHVDDLVRGIMHAAASDPAIGRTYFLGSECFYSIRELSATIARVLDRRVFRLHLPHCLVYSVGGAATLAGKVTGAQVFFNLNKAREAVQPAWTCSVDRAKSELGFRQEVSLEAGMRSTCRWYYDNGWM